MSIHEKKQSQPTTPTSTSAPTHTLTPASEFNQKRVDALQDDTLHHFELSQSGFDFKHVRACVYVCVSVRVSVHMYMCAMLSTFAVLWCAVCVRDGESWACDEICGEVRSTHW
jgi:hypothetical protein